MMCFLIRAFLILHTLVIPVVFLEVIHTSGGKDFCIVEGRPYSNGEIIPREHKCHICICHLGKAECSWMNCPSPPDGCTEFSVENGCNPQLYVCTIPKHLRGARSLRSIEQSRIELDTLPADIKESGIRSTMNGRSRREADVLPTTFDEFMLPTEEHEVKLASGDCHVLGVPYQTGDLMGIASSFCLECRCARENMYCSPKCCFKYAGFYLTPSELEAAQRSPKLSLDHPLSHLLKW